MPYTYQITEIAAPISELPSNIRTMYFYGNVQNGICSFIPVPINILIDPALDFASNRAFKSMLINSILRLSCNQTCGFFPVQINIFIDPALDLVWQVMETSKYAKSS